MLKRYEDKRADAAWLNTNFPCMMACPAHTNAGRYVELIGEGLTNREIGARMFLAEKTVKNYVSSVLSKLGLVRRTQAAVLVTELRRDAER